ncbi:hypothetical protein [Breoghania sp.]|uniref:hypothetical protein n=1 Tax=Breoghania sp. TaxID=2065378 RepID=UPI0026318E26|nr:hypothetical protein [Breoghania sp.]MDJ0932243.1 hypothetical protein [Breoghania sp.]
MRENATSLAVNAYLRSSGDDARIQALEALALSLQARSLWKPTIRSYRAALAIREDARLAPTTTVSSTNTAFASSSIRSIPMRPSPVSA